MTETNVVAERDNALVGNRFALAGAVLYLLEWVAIIAAAPPGPYGPATAASTILRNYTGHAGAAAISAAWFAVVLVGRILYVAGVKASLRKQPRQLPLLDLALGAMTVSVVLEIVAYGILAATARLASDGAGRELVQALDGSAYWVNVLIWGPIGVSVLATGIAMLRSRVFAGWLSWLGVVAGAAGIAGCIVAGAVAGRSGTGPADAVTSIAALGVWIWMIATGVVLFRRS
jgi:hypothetical protein